MWRKIIAFFFLISLAQLADASLIVEEHKNNVDDFEQSITLTKQLIVSSFDNDEPEDVFNLPRLTRISPSLFSAEVQTSANYVLVIEFLKTKLNAAMFKILSNPPDLISWFEQLSHHTNSSRLSGWKDGNFLYCARTTYHS